MDDLAKIFLVIQKELENQSKKLNDCVEKVSKEIQELDNKFSKVKTINEQRLNTSNSEQKKEIENNIKFNKYLYDLELRNKMLKKSEYKNQIKMCEMYFVRCTIFMNYMVARENHNEIQITQTFFAFVNHVQEEFVKNYQFKKDYYLEKKNIHEEYTLLLSLFPSIDENRRSQIEKKLLSLDEYSDILLKIIELDDTLENYKQIFKTRKPNIIEKNINNKIYFNFEIKKVVESIYPGLLNEISNKK